MRRRVLFFLFVPVLLLSSVGSSAEAQELQFSGGGGALLVNSDPCNNDDTGRCGVEQVRFVALSPILGVGGHLTTGGGIDSLGLRFGGWGELATIGSDAGVFAGRMEAGIALGPLTADLGLGVGFLWMDDRGRTESDQSFSLGATLALRLSRAASLSARASIHVAIRTETLAAGFAGLTLDWFPDLPLFR